MIFKIFVCLWLLVVCIAMDVFVDKIYKKIELNNGLIQYIISVFSYLTVTIVTLSALKHFGMI